MRFVDVILSLFKNTVTKNYQNSKIIINLSFVIAVNAKQLNFCEIIHEIKNSFNHLLINIIFDLRA